MPRLRQIGLAKDFTLTISTVLSIRTFCTFLREFSPFFLIRPCDLKWEPWS